VPFLISKKGQRKPEETQRRKQSQICVTQKVLLRPYFGLGMKEDLRVFGFFIKESGGKGVYKMNNETGGIREAHQS